MKRAILYHSSISTLLLCAFIFVGSLSLQAQSWKRNATGVEVNTSQDRILIEYYTPSIVRITKTPLGHSLTRKSLSVTAQPNPTKLNVQEENGRQLSLSSSKVKVQVSLTDGEISFHNISGKSLFSESAPARFTPVDDAGRATYCIRQDFVLDADEPIYGMGQPQNEALSQRHVNRYLQPQNVEDGIPFFASPKGYGIFWDNYSATTYNDDANGTYFQSEVGDGVDYYFLYGGNLDGVVAQMRQLTGDVPMFPLWAYGFWQSRERYKSDHELETVVAKYRQLGIPLDGIVQDWQYWGNNYLWNAMDFLAPEFQDGKQMIDSVHHQNAHIIFTIWSSFGLIHNNTMNWLRKTCCSTSAPGLSRGLASGPRVWITPRESVSMMPSTLKHATSTGNTCVGCTTMAPTATGWTPLSPTSSTQRKRTWTLRPGWDLSVACAVPIHS